MARRRDNEIELDFDGLADSLTDLVGTLTLFVFLLFVLSNEIRPPAAAPSVPTIGWEQVAGKSRSIADLKREVSMLDRELATLNGAIKQEETQMAPLGERIDALIRKASAPPAAAPAGGNTKGSSS